MNGKINIGVDNDTGLKNSSNLWAHARSEALVEKEEEQIASSCNLHQTNRFNALLHEEHLFMFVRNKFYLIFCEFVDQ